MTTRQTLTIQTPEDRQRIATWAKNVDVGTIVEFRKKTRSHEQSAKMHAMLGEVAAQVVWYGTKLKVEDWKNIFTASLRKAQVVPGIDPGTVVPLGIHTSTMTVDEMSNMIEAIYAFGAERDVMFKDPKQEEEQPNPADHSPDGQPGSGDTPPSPETDEAGDSPSTLASSPLSEAKLRQHLMDFARKAFSTAADKHLTAEQKVGFIDDMRANIKRELPEPTWGKFNTIRLAAERAVQFPQELSERRASIARDFLDCSPADIGGSANG